MVWTDAFQMVVMIVGFLTVLIQGSAQNGGLQNVLDQATNGSRLHIVEYVQCYFLRHYKDLIEWTHQLIILNIE